MGLSITAQKTKILAVTDDLHDVPRRIALQSADEPVEVVEEFEYLGSVVTSVCVLDKEIVCEFVRHQTAIETSARPFGTRSQSSNLFNSECSRQQLYQHSCMAVRPGPFCLSTLRNFVMHCLRIILGISAREKQRNTTIRTLARIETVDTMIRKRRLMAGPCSQN